MRIVYVSGAYSAPTIEETRNNIEFARSHAIDLWRLGLGVVCPHLNTMFFEMHGIPYEQMMEFDLLLLNRVDAIFMLPNWTQSKGAFREWDYANKLGIPIFYSIEEINKWFNETHPT